MEGVRLLASLGVLIGRWIPWSTSFFDCMGKKVYGDKDDENLWTLSKGGVFFAKTLYKV